MDLTQSAARRYPTGRMVELNGQVLVTSPTRRDLRRRAGAGRAGGSSRGWKRPAKLYAGSPKTTGRYYGINTGFGKLCDVRIPDGDIERLQLNLVRSHACGVGPPLSEPGDARDGGVARQHAGARIQRRAARGRGDAVRDGQSRRTPRDSVKGLGGRERRPGSAGSPCAVCDRGGRGDLSRPRAAGRRSAARAGIGPLRLEAKEGLALLNGTQAMTAVGALGSGARTARAARRRGGALVARSAAGHARRVRCPHSRRASARGADRSRPRICAAAWTSEMSRPPAADPRTCRTPTACAACRRCMARCAARWHSRASASRSRPAAPPTIRWSSPNPATCCQRRQLPRRAAGARLRYRGDRDDRRWRPLAERRIDRLVNPDLNQGLPRVSRRDPGWVSGFMIAQVAAVSLLNEAKVLAHPASVDSLPTSGGKEDHVSMGMTAASNSGR